MQKDTYAPAFIKILCEKKDKCHNSGTKKSYMTQIRTWSVFYNPKRHIQISFESIKFISSYHAEPILIQTDKGKT